MVLCQRVLGSRRFANYTALIFKNLEVLFSSVASCFVSLESKYCTLKQTQSTALLYTEIPNFGFIKRFNNNNNYNTNINTNEDVLLRVKEHRNILHEIRKWKANWIGHILRRNCLLQRVIEGKIKGGMEVTGRRGRRRKKLSDNLKEMSGYSNLKEEPLDRTVWRVRFGGGFGPVVRQTAK
jgi:hypothetical protein